MALAVHGLDRAAAPSAETAKQMLDAIGGRWWNVYIGGPESGGHGWTPALLREYVRHGIDRFMLTYVGRQSRGPLTEAQGEADAHDAVRIANAFGYSGNVPLCLDVEHRTYESAPAAAISYAHAWCRTVRALGARPGVYANPEPLTAMHGSVAADFVWVASWVSHVADQHDPRSAPHLPATFWANPGQRAWQFAGEFNGNPCRVLSLDVDINVADLDCLALPPGTAVVRRPATKPGAVRLGDTGAAVVQLTRALSFVPSDRMGRPYLAAPRRTFDASVEKALRAFQSDHGLTVDGLFGPASAQALKRAVRLETARRRSLQPAAAGAPPVDGPAPAGFAALLDRAHLLDAQAAEAWTAVLAYGHGRTPSAAQARAEEVSLADVVSVLTKIQNSLATLVADGGSVEVRVPAGVAAAQAAAAVGATATVLAPTVAGNGAEPEVDRPRTLQELTDAELVSRIDRLDRALDRSRSVLVARFALNEKTLARHAPASGTGNGSGVIEAEVTQPAAGAGARTATPVRAPRRIVPTPGVRNLQVLLNQFTRRFLAAVPPLVVDGKNGPETKKRIRAVRYYLGYAGSGAKSSTVDAQFVKRLRHPRRGSPAALARASSRRRAQHNATGKSAAPHAGVTAFDGKPVAEWMKPYLDWARVHGWRGTLNSGWRDPVHSQQICKEKCGAVKCPGTCAGLSSNHVGRIKPLGAVDVSDPATFGALMHRCPLSPRLINALPHDPVHFSVTGH
jgi:peptidoglycan hydrolase-like protein with peptidoglycan-binding domain